jgi:hypothetical protein
VNRSVLVAVSAASCLACSGLMTPKYQERVVEVEDRDADLPEATETVRAWYGGMDPISCRDCDFAGLDAVVTATASSSAPDDRRKPHGPEAAVDRDKATAWCSTGGAGEWLELQFAQPVDLDGVALFGGWFDGEFELFRHQRVAEVLIAPDQGRVVRANVEDAARGPDQYLSIVESPLTFDQGWTGIRSIRFEFRDTFPGREGLGLCVSSIDLYGRLSG